MGQPYQSLDAYQSRWIRLGMVPLLDEAKVERTANEVRLHEHGVPKPAYRSVAEETDVVLESTMPGVERWSKTADDTELARALNDYKDMVQRRRETLAMEEYYHLVERIGELTADDDCSMDESECIVEESATSFEDPYDADDEMSLCEESPRKESPLEGATCKASPCEYVPAPSTRATTPSFAWSEDEGESSVSSNICTTSHVSSPDYSWSTYHPWTGVKLLDRLVALPTAGEWKYSKFEQDEYIAGAEGKVERLTMDTIFENPGLAMRGLVGRRP